MRCLGGMMDMVVCVNATSIHVSWKHHRNILYRSGTCMEKSLKIHGNVQNNSGKIMEISWKFLEISTNFPHISTDFNESQKILDLILELILELTFVTAGVNFGVNFLGCWS